MGKLLSSVIFFVTLFVLLGYIEPAYATMFQISDQASCNAIGGVWAAGTCTLSDSLIISSSDTLIIDSGVTLEIALGKSLTNSGQITNNGIITLTGDATNGGGRLINKNSGTFTNSGTLNVNGASGKNTGQIYTSNTSAFINSGTINIVGSDGENSGALKITGKSTFTNTNTIIITGSSGQQSGYIAVIQSGVFTSSGTVTISGGSGNGSGLLDNWDGATVSNSGIITITGNTGTNTGRILNMGTSIFTNNGLISIIGGNGVNSGRLINSQDGYFDNLKTITILAGGGPSNTLLFILDDSTLKNSGTVTLSKNLKNSAKLNNFGKISIGNDLANQGTTINNCGTISITGILIGNKIVESGCFGSVSHEDPTIGKTSWGFQAVENGICIDITCWTVTADYHQDFELVEMLSDSTHTISTTVYCHNGVSKCNYVAFGVSPYGTNINDSVWKIILQKDFKDNWSMTVIDPESYLGDVTSTTQIVNDEKNLAASITALFKKPTLGMILNVETRDSYGGYNDFKFNDGIEIIDAYAYPVIDTSYDEPLDVKPLCLNENPNKRYTCAFDMVKEWTIKNAEKTLSQQK